MSQTVHFQGNAVPVAGQFPQAGDKAKAFTLVAKNLLTSRSLSMQENAKF